jgi:hypothetical protein
MLVFPDRFELHVLDYTDTITYLQHAFELLAGNKRPDSRVILTVSPVALNSSYRAGIDVITANACSKSVLRAAAEEIVAKFDFVEYFPSYESVTLSRRDLA